MLLPKTLEGSARMTQTTAGAGRGPFSAHELKGWDFAPLQFVVDGLVPLGLTVLAGAPKVGKSWLSLDIALSVARGTAVLDENVHRCVKGAVLYLALEDSERRLRGRLEQLLGTGPDWPRNLFFETEWPGMHADGLERLDQWIAATEGARLIVIDVFQKFRSIGLQAGYEQDYRDLTKLLDLARHTQIGIILVHHLRKSGGGDPFERITGSAGFLGVPDTNIVLDKGRGGTRLLAQGRDIEEISREIVFDPLARVWRLARPRAVVRHPERDRIRAILQASPSPMGAIAIAAQTGQTANAVSKMLGEMFGDGEVVKAGWGLYADPTPLDAVNDGGDAHGAPNAQNSQNALNGQKPHDRPQSSSPNDYKRMVDRERRERLRLSGR